MSDRMLTQTFYDIINNTPLPGNEKWTMTRLDDEDVSATEDWYQVIFRTKARFLCNASHVWESGWATILCRFHLNFTNGQGEVLLRTYGQRCTTCQNDQTYHRPVFDSDRGWQAVQHILYRILITYYREHNEEIEKRHTIVARHFKLENPKTGSPKHRKDFCEACRAGHCIMK